MMLLVVAAALFAIAVAAATVAWVRRHHARRDLEGYFQHEWDERERWASLADVDPDRQEAVRADQERSGASSREP